MVLLSFGRDLTEAELRALCDCTIFGTTAVQAVAAAKHLGFSQTRKANLSFAELYDEVKQGVFPIVFLNLLMIDGLGVEHAMVVTDIDPITVTLCDPIQGTRALPAEIFVVAWATMNHLAILLRP